jgi:hypothetical protein
VHSRPLPLFRKPIFYILFIVLLFCDAPQLVEQWLPGWLEFSTSRAFPHLVVMNQDTPLLQYCPPCSPDAFLTRLSRMKHHITPPTTSQPAPMANFTFRAYIPRPEPTVPPPSSSESVAHRSGPTTASSTVFSSVTPDSVLEPAAVSYAMPLAQSSSIAFKTFTPPPVVSRDVKRGSYQYDLASGKYPLSWTSLSNLEAWIRAEESQKSIELALKEVVPNKGKGAHHWSKKHVYVCARMGTGGKSKYIPKNNQERKIGSKRTPCQCRLVVKIYPSTDTLLGTYENDHSHPIGSQNLIYTHIPAAVLCRIEDDLRNGVRPESVVSTFALSHVNCL